MLGDAIRDLRKLRGYSQRGFAERCGMSQNAINNIESNKTYPNKTTIGIICIVLGVKSSYLFFMSIPMEEIKEDKKDVFIILHDALKKIILC